MSHKLLRKIVFEYFLANREPVIDVPAQQQWGDKLPVVRRVKLDEYHERPGGGKGT